MVEVHDDVKNRGEKVPFYHKLEKWAEVLVGVVKNMEEILRV